MALRPYHTGIVVPHLEPAVEEWQSATGMPWAPVLETRTAVRLGAGLVEVPFRMAYSRDLTIELVEELAGTLWTVQEGPVHHTGCWSDDLAADSARLAARGWERAAAGAAGGVEPSLFAYHRLPGGGFLELVDAALAASMEQYAASG